MTCAERQDEMFLYAIDGLDSIEQQEARAHLDGGCPRCAGSLAEAQGMAGLLVLSSPAVMPSPAVGQRLMARVNADLNKPGDKPEPAPKAKPKDSSRGRWRDWLGSDWGRLILVMLLSSGITYLVTTTPFTREGQAWKDNYYEKYQESQEYHQQLEAARERIRQLEAERGDSQAPSEP
jgi:hypothetical protein